MYGGKLLKRPASKVRDSSTNSWQSGTFSNVNGQEIRSRRLNGNNNNNTNEKDDGSTADNDISTITSI